MILTNFKEVPSIMRKFFLSGGIIGILVLLFVHLTTPISITLLLPLLLLPFICFLFVIIEKKLQKTDRLVFMSIGFCAAFIIGLAFVLSVTLIVANFPPGSKYNEELVLDYGSPSDQAKYDELNNLMKNFNESANQINIKIIDNEYKLDSASIEVLKSTKDNRDAVINFLKTNSFAIPEKYYSQQSNQIHADESTVNSNSIEDNMYHTRNLMKLFRLELLEVSSLLQSNNYEEALIKYKDLWKVENNIFYIKNHTVVDCVVYVGSVNLLLEFYDKNHNVFKTEDLHDIKQILDNMASNITDLFYQGFAKEYHMNTDYFNSYIDFKWPFFDKYKTAKKYHDHYNKLAQSFKSEELNEIKETEEFTPETISIKDYFINPVGSVYFKMGYSQFNGIEQRVFEIKDKLNKLSQSL